MSRDVHATASVDPGGDAPLVPAPPEDVLTEVAALEDEASRSAPEVAARLLHHVGWLHESRRGDRAAAADAYRRARARVPAYRPALESLQRIVIDTGDWPAAAALYAEELATTKDPFTQAELLKTLADVHEERLGDPTEARLLRLRALETMPQHHGLLAFAIDDAATRGDLPGELKLRKRAAEATRDDRLKARHLERAARLAEQLGDATEVSALRRQLVSVAPHGLATQATMLPRLRREKDEGALEKLARAEVDATSTTQARVRLARMLAARDGGVESDLEGVDDAAHEILNSAREINPRDSATHEALVELAELRHHGEVDTHLKTRFETARDPLAKGWTALRLARHAHGENRHADAATWDARARELLGDHPELASGGHASTPDAERMAALDLLATATEPADKARAAYVLGALADEAADRAEAEARWLDALSYEPSNLAARMSLVRLYERDTDWAALSAFTEKEYLFAQEPDHKRHALVSMAEVFEHRLSDPASAAAAYRMALELSTDPEAASALLRCAEAANKRRDVDFAKRKLEEGGEVPLRQQLVSAHRKADEARRRGSIEEAIAGWEACLVLVPEYAPAVRALNLLRPVEGSPNEAPRVAAAAVRTALSVRDHPAALPHLEKLASLPGTPPTVWADLARCRRATRDFAGAVDALGRWIDALTDGIARADQLLSLAELAEEELEDPDRAIDALRKSTAVMPRHAPSWKMLARLLFAKGDLAGAATALEQEVVVAQLKDRTDARRRLAEVVERLGDSARARTLLQEIVEQDGADLWALADLDRLHAAAGDLLGSAGFRTRLAARCSDPRAAAALRVSAADDRRRGGDATGAWNEYRRALALDARQRSIAERVLAHMRATNDRAGLVDLNLRTAPGLALEHQAAMALQRGDLLLTDGQIALALRCYRDAASQDPLLLPAFRAARRLHEASGEWDDVRVLFAQEAEAIAPETAFALVVEAGRLAERLGNAEQAESHYLRALELQPGNEDALVRLDALHRSARREDELVALYEREGDAVAAEPGLSARWYAEAAWLRWERNEGRRALVPLNRALARDPGNLRALELKATIALAEGRPGEAEEALHLALEKATPVARPGLLRRRAESLLALGRASDAIAPAREAVDTDGAPESLMLLARTAEAAGNPAFAKEANERLNQAVQQAPGEMRLRVALARTWSTTQATWPAAVNELRNVIAHRPLDAEAHRALLSVFDRAARTDAAFVALGTIVGLRLATTEEQARYAALVSMLKPAGVALAAADVELLVHPAERASPLRELFAALEPALRRVLPGNPEAHGVSRTDRIGGDVRAATTHFTKVFGLGEVDLLAHHGNPEAAWVENTEPPTLVLGANRTAPPLGKWLFTVGSLLGRIRMRNHAAFFARPAELANLVAEALRQIDPAFSKFGGRNDALGAALGRSMGRTERKSLENLLPRFTQPVDFDAATAAMHLTAHRFGLVASGDPAAALGVLVGASAPAAFERRTDVRELVSFALGEEHLTLRQKLKTVVG